MTKEEKEKVLSLADDYSLADVSLWVSDMMPKELVAKQHQARAALVEYLEGLS